MELSEFIGLKNLLKELNLKANGRQVLIVDGKLLKVARLSRTLTQKIKRGFGGKSCGRRKRKFYSQHQKKEIRIDELVYGLLVLVEEKGKMVDIWLKPRSMNEAKALKER